MAPATGAAIMTPVVLAIRPSRSRWMNRVMRTGRKPSPPSTLRAFSGHTPAAGPETSPPRASPITPRTGMTHGATARIEEHGPSRHQVTTITITREVGPKPLIPTGGVAPSFPTAIMCGGPLTTRIRPASGI